MAGRPVTLLGVNADQMSRSALKEKFAKYGVTWPQIIDEKQALSQRWNVYYYPQMFVIDQQGVIRARGKLMDAARLEKEVEALLAGQP